jgi:hypothetical protein
MVSQGLQSAQAAIKSKYAAMGLSGSTMETQDLNAAQTNASSQAFQMANTLTQTGLTEAGVSQSDLGGASTIYQAIMNEQLSADEALQKALAQFASAAAFGSGASGTSNAGSLLSSVGSGISSGASWLSNLFSGSDTAATA